MGRRSRLGWLAAAAGLAAGSGALALAYQRDMAVAWARLVGRSQVVESPYGRIEYADAGVGPPVLVIHGSGGGFDQGLAFGDRLTSQGLRVIAPSRFGYLRSDFPEGASPEMQADALAWLLRARGIERTVVFGGSAGALSAMQLAIRHPELCRGLILGVPASYAPDRAPHTNAAPNPAVQAAIDAALGSDFLFWLAVRFAPDFMTRMVLATDPALVRAAPPEERERVHAVLMRILPVSPRKRGVLMDSATAGAPPPYPIERIDCPILVVSARDDFYGTAQAAEYIAANAKDARLILYDTGGHLWVGHNAAVWAEVGRFVQGLR